jgi:hypothetical protein
LPAPVPEHDAARNGIRFITEAFAATGKSPRIGTGMPGHFLRAGIGVPDGIDVHGQIVPATIGCAMIAGVLRSLAQVIADRRIAERERFDATLAEIDALASEPGRLVRIPDLIATWKRKPLAAA